MKVAFIVLCFALAVFAQKQQDEHENFTIGQRFGTWGLNTVAPGLGSAVIMQDWLGTSLHLVFFGTGAIFMVSWFYSSKISEYESSDISKVYLLSMGLSAWICDAIFNIVRSATYNEPENIFGKNDGFHLSILPNRYGKIMPYLLFSKAF
jgi:hypothetical protein